MKAKYISQDDTSELESLHTVRREIRPELSSAHDCVRRILHISVAAINLCIPANHRGAVGGALGKPRQVEIDVLGSAIVGSDNDQLFVSGIVCSNHVGVATIENAHARADMSRELRQHPVLLVHCGDLTGVVVCLYKPPAAAIECLPVDPSCGEQPPEIQEEVSGEIETRTNSISIFAVPKFFVGCRCQTI